MSDGTIIAHLIVRGRVQGVGYRAWIERAALTADIEGWVRNCSDGSVEVVFQGFSETVEALIERCREGPRGAHVEAIDRRTAVPELLRLRRPGERFSVLPTT